MFTPKSNAYRCFSKRKKPLCYPAYLSEIGLTERSPILRWVPVGQTDSESPKCGLNLGLPFPLHQLYYGTGAMGVNGRVSVVRTWSDGLTWRCFFRSALVRHFICSFSFSSFLPFFLFPFRCLPDIFFSSPLDREVGWEIGGFTRSYSSTEQVF